MLYGVRRDLQRKLVREGYKVRVYVPFGSDWYPYFMRRLAERPANVIFLAKNFLPVLKLLFKEIRSSALTPLPASAPDAASKVPAS